MPPLPPSHALARPDSRTHTPRTPRTRTPTATLRATTSPRRYSTPHRTVASHACMCTAASVVHQSRIRPASDCNHSAISLASLVHHSCISLASKLHPSCISSVSRIVMHSSHRHLHRTVSLHSPCIRPAFAVPCYAMHATLCPRTRSRTPSPTRTRTPPRPGPQPRHVDTARPPFAHPAVAFAQRHWHRTVSVSHRTASVLHRTAITPPSVCNQSCITRASALHRNCIASVVHQ
jgi:hypothetical protein